MPVLSEEVPEEEEVVSNEERETYGQGRSSPGRTSRVAPKTTTTPS